MRPNYLKATFKTAVLAVTVLLLGAGLAVAQQTVNLTAGPANLVLPDGSSVPMWGYTCNVSGTALASGAQACAPLDPAVALLNQWSPIVITVPAGQPLSISLTNKLPAPVTETSLMIVGQLGGGLGNPPTTTPSPDHSAAQSTATWPIVGANPDSATPPPQVPRVSSFSTPALNGGSAVTLTWSSLKPGTYLIESGTHPSIQGPMGLYGMVVVTTAPVTTGTAARGIAYSTPLVVNYDADVDLLFSEIDPVQNNAVNTAVNTPSFSETMVWSGQPGGCGYPTSPTYHQCYPPAVNYTPLYYMVNGVAFNRNGATASLFSAAPASGVPAAGTVLVRMVNAGLRMHIPSIVGSLTGTPATPGFGLIAEDGNELPGVTRVQNEVFMAAGKTYDVMVNVPATGSSALPIYDRELSLSGNKIERDAGMLAYIGVNGSVEPTTGAFHPAAATANDDTYPSIIAGQTFSVLDPSKGVLANDINVYGVAVQGTAPAGLTLNADGTFVYTAGTPVDFKYCGNGGATCATVHLTAATLEGAGGITCAAPPTFTSATGPVTGSPAVLSIKPPGILAFCKDAMGYPLTVNAASVTPASGLTLSVDPNGGFNASVTAAGPYSFTFKPQNSQGVVMSAAAVSVSLSFPAATGLNVTVYDPVTKAPVTDYRWVIEEDRTFYVNPNCTTNPPTGTCPGSAGNTIVPTFGTNFHTSYMPVVATGCTGLLSCESGQMIFDNGTPCTSPGVPAGCSATAGQHIAAVCDVGNGVCRPDTSGNGFAAVFPSQVVLNANKRYYISVLPGDAANPFQNGYAKAPACTLKGGAIDTSNPNCGHGMGGAPIGIDPNTGVQTTAVTILTQPSPYPPSKLSVFVFEDDFPLNGEQDGGGGVDVLSPNEPGLGGFNITLFDDAGGTGDATGQMTYDMFNMPLSNSLSGQKDPATGLDACPISASARVGSDGTTASPTGITGTIVTCPKYEADGHTLSPLAGQAVIANLMPGRYGVVATPAADRIARGEEWLQTNTLDGQKAHDSFLRIGEPSFFQEFGPAGYHVSIGFANPQIINDRKQFVCNGTDPNITGTHCGNTITGIVSTERMSRTPDERLYGSGDNSSFSFTQCYVSFGDPDGEDFAFTKCASDGTFTLSGLPDGSWRLTVFDQWNDMLVDGLSTPVGLSGGASGTVTNLGEIAMNQWQANIYTSTFFDTNGNGVRDPGEDGLTLVATNNRFRDGSYSNFNNTDLSGNAGFNEIFPLFSWYVIETDTTRYKSTGTHVVYDAGGPADGSPGCKPGTTAPCGSSSIGSMMANTAEVVSVPTALRVPGAVYCAGADCSGKSIASGPASSDPPSVCSTTTAGVTTCSTQLSTGRIDPAWVQTEAWQGFSGQNSFIEFGKKPFAVGETGGIHGEVIYASTRPFDDPTLLIHTSWTPDVPGVTVNLYKEGSLADGTTSLTLVDTTTTTSWDIWAQGFRSDSNPNMNCPGQGRDTGTIADLFFFTLYNQPMWLDVYNNNGAAANTVPSNSQFKCYDGMHSWNQVQPAPYDGYYSFPSIASINPTTGQTTTNCTGCVPNPDTTDPYRSGQPMLPAGKYVVEMIVPPGYELVKEEDKNILIGDNYIAPVTQQFAGLGDIFIMPDQAEVNALYNSTNPQNPTQTLGRTTLPNHEGDTGSVETFWPCVGALRVVPDYISLFPQSLEVSPFAGATRNLCDRKEVTLTEQTSALAKFWVFTSAHVAAHFTGVITDDYTSEFDPFSPQFGEKFSPPNLPVSLKDWSGTEISRVYSDQWGTYNGLTYSTWEVNPPNPTGYAPTMMVVCMNDPGPILDTRVGSATNGQMITDPLFNPQYSQFCYEIPFMPGQTQYMDTPVVPTAAYAGAGYNNPDCSYPDTTPAIAEVDGDGVGPWVSAAGHTLTIKALGLQTVPNNAYSGPSTAIAPFNAKAVTRNYGFGTQQGTVMIGGVNAAVTGWSDTQITVTAPATTGPGSVAACAVQQQNQYQPAGTSQAHCGQLVITRGDNGKQSIDTVTVTIGGKAPTHVAASALIQPVIDSAKPGDLIILDPTCTPAAGGAAEPCTTTGVAGGPSGIPAGASTSQAAHNEMLLMWKPVRLQGVGAASSVINANTHPAGKMDGWRRQVNCLFGLALNGTPIGAGNPYDPAGTFSCTGTGQSSNPTDQNFQVDRLPLEAAVGWDATQNGNLAELLQEPTLMGALEGAAITVLGKGVQYPKGVSPWNDGTETGGFPTGTILLQNVPGYIDGNGNRVQPQSNQCNKNPNPFPSNFMCNPSSIDGLTITNSSQGGGGIYVHGWNHNLQIANNRVTSNAGTLAGGINVGQGEHPGANTYQGINTAPDTCSPGTVVGVLEPYCFDMDVNIHHNAITNNSSTGDELFSATPAGAGGVSICNGSDYYKFNYNWVCGNLSGGDGGGVGHMGLSFHGDIEYNTVLFNQSTNPTIPANGGGIAIMGAPDVDPTCGATTDQDCVPAAGSVGPSDGTGPGLVINANLIMGNSAESGSGGGLRLQNINGSDVVQFPTTPTRWNDVTITNNIIADNVAGWDGAGISMLDALDVNIVNNTIISNDTTASSGVLFNTLGAPLASDQGTNCIQSGGTTKSCAQPAGLVSLPNSASLTGSLPATITCPLNHGVHGTSNSGRNNGDCRYASYPELYNNIFWQNRAFYIGVGSLGTGGLNQQNVVALFNAFSNTGAVSQPQADATSANGGGVVITGGTGACVSPASYWDIGIRGDTSQTGGNKLRGGTDVRLSPQSSVIDDLADYPGSGGLLGVNSNSNPTVVSQYCNGSRVPPELGSMGYQVPPGISDATVPNPIFNLTPAATVDEGNNWINISWGPLSLVNTSNGTNTGTTLGNYAPASGSPVINYITPLGAPTTYAAAPGTDFFGHPRKTAADPNVDIGAVEAGAAALQADLSVTKTDGVTSVLRGQALTYTIVVTNHGPSAVANGTVSDTLPGASRFTVALLNGWSCTATAGSSCTATGSGNATRSGIVNLVSGGSATYTLRGSVAGAAPLGAMTNTVNVGVPASVTDPIMANNTASDTDTIVAPSGNFTPSPLAFGNQSVRSTSSAMTATFNNTSGVDITLRSGLLTPAIIITGANASNFANAAGTTCTNGAVVVAGGSCIVNLTFTPSASGARAATLNLFVAGSFAALATDSLTGTGVLAALTFSGPSPALTTTPATTATKSGLVTVTNGAGAAGTFTFTAAPAANKVGGPAAASFSVIAGGTCTSTTVLAPGANCTINVQYAPGGSTTGATGNVTVTGSGLAGGSQTSGNFPAN